MKGETDNSVRPGSCYEGNATTDEREEAAQGEKRGLPDWQAWQGKPLPPPSGLDGRCRRASARGGPGGGKERPGEVDAWDQTGEAQNER